MAEVEKVARELLAAEYEADDMAHIAAMLRAGGDGHMPTQAALRAIQAGIVAGLEEAKGLLADTYPDSMSECENCHDQPWSDGLAAIQARIGEVNHGTD